MLSLASDFGYPISISEALEAFFYSSNRERTYGGVFTTVSMGEMVYLTYCEMLICSRTTRRTEKILAKRGSLQRCFYNLIDASVSQKFK